MNEKKERRDAATSTAAIRAGNLANSRPIFIVPQKADFFIRAREAARLAGVSLTPTYALIREINEEARADGEFTISGRCNRFRFLRKLGYEPQWEALSRGGESE